jgi:D-glycero-D-manno-heptose 1,7-bisphosphate phosphatase
MTRSALFVDRDGTMIREVGFLHRPEEVELVLGVGEALRRVNDAGRAVVVVTNQSGIARGLFDRDAVDAVHARLSELLAAFGARVDGYYVSPHHPAFTHASRCRKPGTGMFEEAARDLGLQVPDSLMVGDRASDVEAGKAFGVRSMLVRTGYGREAERELRGERAPDGVFDTLPDAVTWWLRQEPSGPG